MKQFMDEDFLLTTSTARRLYYEFAKDMPIYDYHCHLSPREIAENIGFRNIGHLMLGGDHYKWRAMAAFGIPDELIRGDADDYARFRAYAKAMPYMIGNPLYHWTHLELQRVFGIDTPLSERTADEIWEKANALLATDAYRAKRLIERFNVKLVCTTDDPIDDLAWHAKIAQDADFHVKVLPTFRPDKAINVDRAGFADYIKQLGALTGVEIRTTADAIAALEARVDYFHRHGARISDHGLDRIVYAPVDTTCADAALACALRGDAPDTGDAEQYKTALLIALGAMYKQRGWAQQYHMNALRNNNTAMFEKHGPDTGFDSISDEPVGDKLSRLLDAQERAGALPKTVLYSLNPAANHMLASMAGNFQTEAGVRGKVQFGSAWWFLDQRDGMVEQMRTLASIGLLGTFIGMLTDSRSFVSYPRHEYFRRILCDILGTWVENGEYPADFEMLGEIVRGICYENAKAYFDIAL
ncbi:MAG: glucuronate isomerase [Christensenellales bacterium]|jgi:glucuronate isomerase